MTSAQYTVGSGSAVKIFTGPGQFMFRRVSGDPYLWVGGNSSVTSSDGTLVGEFKGELSDASEIWVITSSTNADVRVLSWY